jgi:plasmid stabilization system protein ParE
MAKRNIHWDKEASEDFIAILQYIAQDSPENAIRVSNRVWKIINTLPEFPEMFKADELKSKNMSNFRVFISDRIRVSYQITQALIRIVSVRHTSQEPLEY